jgi:serine/threonine protein kinase
MGVVYLARSPGGRTVAVKVIRPDLAEEPGFRTRFAREIAAAKGVNGMFTALVVDADTEGPVPWLATAYVPGPSLAVAVEQQGALPPDSVLALGAGLAEGVQAIHAAGVVHRDLKPSNVLLSADGPRVIDFGISQAREASILTQAGIVMGSPGFLSPEQAEGQVVGPPTDIFSLGSLLVFAATGEGPFGSGAVPALLYRVVARQPDLSNVPEVIRPIADACLQKDPAARPTAQQLLDTFDRLGSGVGVITPEWLPKLLTDAFSRYIPKGRAAPGEIGPASATAEPTSGGTQPGRTRTQPVAAAPVAWGVEPPTMYQPTDKPAPEVPAALPVSNPTIIVPIQPAVPGALASSGNATQTSIDPRAILNPDTITTRAEFHQALRTLKEFSDLSVKDVATVIGLPPSTVGGYFGGRSMPGQREVLRRLLLACGLDADSTVKWELAFIRVRSVPKPRRAGSPGETTPPQPDEQPDLMLRVYVPAERLYAAEMRKVLGLFGDWLTATHHHGVRQSGYRTSSGEMFEFYADDALRGVPEPPQLDAFSNFLELCADSPAEASGMLDQNGIEPVPGSALVARFGKEYRRLQVDLRQERERRIMTLRHTLEGELLENGVDLLDAPSIPLDSLLERLVPGSSGLSSMPALPSAAAATTSWPVNVTVNHHVVSTKEYVENTIIHSIQGTDHLAAQARQLLALIDQFGGANVSPLRTAVLELEDPEAPTDHRVKAKQTLKSFVTQLSGKIQDTALTILEKYLESKLGLG